MRSSRVPDPFLEKVTAWTDNGAYFFYNTFGQERLPPAQSALPKWIKLLNAAGISVNSLQLDGWWMNQTTSTQNNKLIPDFGLTGSFSFTPTYDESKYYSWRSKKVGNISIFVSDSYEPITYKTKKFNLGWTLDFRSLIGSKSQNYSINGTSAKYKQSSSLTREISLIGNLDFQKKFKNNGILKVGVDAKNTTQGTKSIGANLEYKIQF